jgi:hypothetical protein
MSESVTPQPAPAHTAERTGHDVFRPDDVADVYTLRGLTKDPCDAPSVVLLGAAHTPQRGPSSLGA